MSCLARRASREARARPGVGLRSVRPAIFCAGSCSGRTNFIVLQAGPLRLARMARYSRAERMLLHGDKCTHPPTRAQHTSGMCLFGFLKLKFGHF
jgi:hypothetical protein